MDSQYIATPSRSSLAATARAENREGAPTMLEELQRRLNDSIESTQAQAARLREFADSVMGSEPEPGKPNGTARDLPPSGRGHQLLEEAAELARALTDLRVQVDRLNRI